MLKQVGLFTDSGDFASDPEKEFARLRERVPRLERNIKHLLLALAVIIRPCKRCGLPLYFILERSGQAVPYGIDAAVHDRATCGGRASEKESISV